MDILCSNHVLFCFLQIMAVSLLSNLYTFYFFNSIIVLDNIFNTMLNKNNGSGYSCVVTYLREEAFSVSPLSSILEDNSYQERKFSSVTN